jgi:SEC-C motif-containing protein
VLAGVAEVAVKNVCPCGTRRPYTACCQPYHAGQREPPDAEALMRSRYAAFARGEPDYLWRTLHADHPDRSRDPAEVTRSLRETIRTFKYMGLTILETRSPDADGIARVLFWARLFEKGRERSFVELSEFAHDGEGWRYLAAETRSVAQLPHDPATLTIDAFCTAAPRDR